MGSQVAPAKKKSLLGSMIGGIIILCVACLVISVVYSAINSGMKAVGLIPPDTSTPTPTETLTPSPTVPPTPSETSTVTPEPATQTAIAKTATQQEAILEATGTKTAKYATATFIAQYQPIQAKELITYPDNHTGENIIISGTVFNVQDNQDLQMYVGSSYDAIVVQFDQPFSGIYKDDYITVYGTVNGTSCGTNAFGAQICQPLIDHAFTLK